MIDGIGAVSCSVVIVEVVGVVNDGGIAMITMAMIAMIVVVMRMGAKIDTNGHYCKWSKIRRIIPIIIGWVIGDIHG